MKNSLHVHCKWCDEEARLEARNEDDAELMLDEWRLSMRGRPRKVRFWSCPTCAEWYQDPKETTTDTAESAGQLAHAAATLFDDLKLEVQQLKAEVVELKAEVVELKFELKAEVHPHVAYQAAHDEDIQKLKQKVDKLTAQVTAVPDDDDSSHEG